MLVLLVRKIGLLSLLVALTLIVSYTFTITVGLSSGGKVYLMGNYDQYNVVVTAHGFATVIFQFDIRYVK
jgi:hypothetical protein